MKKILVFSLALASMFSSCKKETEYIQIEVHDTIKNKIEVFLNQPNEPSYSTGDKDLAKKQVEPAIYDKATNSAQVKYSNGAVATFEEIDFDKDEAVLVRLKFDEKSLSKAGEQEEEINLMSSFYIVKDKKVSWIKVKRIGNGKDQVVELPGKKISVTIPSVFQQIKSQALKNANLVKFLSEINVEKDALDQNAVVEIPYSMYDKYLSALENLDEDWKYIANQIQIRRAAALVVGDENFDSFSATPSDYVSIVYAYDQGPCVIRAFVGDYSDSTGVYNSGWTEKLEAEIISAEIIPSNTKIASVVHIEKSNDWGLKVNLDENQGNDFFEEYIQVSAVAMYKGLKYDLVSNVTICSGAK